MARVDPGPPPERGMVVRPEGAGFYARLQPRPRPDVRRFGLPLLAFAVAGAALGWVAGDDPALRIEIFAFVSLFGFGLAAFAFGAGFVPVEIQVDDDTVYWHGDRIPMATVGDCRAERRRLELLGKDGRVLASADHLDPEVARWMALAIRASLPE